MAAIYRNTMLCSPSAVKAATAVNYNVEDGEVGVAIRRAQDIYLQPIIGTKMLRKLQTLVYNAAQNLPDNINDKANEDYAELLNDYVQPLLIAQTLDTLYLQISFKVRNIGVSRDADTNISAAELGEIKHLQNVVRTDIAEYSTRVSRYMYVHKDAYPEELGCTDGVEYPPMLNKTFANTRLWLGGGRKTCKC